MPTVLRVHGFRISVLFPPREHLPPHVHVRSASGMVVIDLAEGDRPQRSRRMRGMKVGELAQAERIVAEHTAMLLDRWREIWESQ